MKNWITAPFILMLALLVAGELIVRVGFSRSMSGRFDYGYNPPSGFEEQPDGTIKLVRVGGRHFFPQSFARVRPPGTYRIMVFGDSVPRGGSVATCYGTQVANELNAQGIKAEAVNLCIGGNGSARTQVVLRKGIEYQPSLVILHADNCDEYDDEREYKRAQDFKSWAPQFWLTKSYLIRRIYEFTTEQIYWAWLSDTMRNTQAVNDDDIKNVESRQQDKRKEWDARFIKNTTESVQLVHAQGIPVLFIVSGRLRFHDGQPYLEDFGVENYVKPLLGPGVYMLTMSDALKTTDYVPFFSDGTHMRPPGHTYLANAIVEKLRAEKLLPAPTTSPSPAPAK